MSEAVASRRAIKSVLHNFLGTYTSRYTEDDGYWLFGKLLPGIDQLAVDLLGSTPPTTAAPCVLVAIELARTRLREQMAKARVPMSRLAAAKLELTRSPDSRSGLVRCHACTGHDLTFRVRAQTDRGKTYQQERTLFVAPHDPEVELRSVRAM